MNLQDLFPLARMLWKVFGPSPFGIVTDLWMLLALYWLISALQRKAAVKREPWLQRLRHLIPMSVAVYLLFQAESDLGWLGKRFVPPLLSTEMVGVTIAALGIALAMWARLHLGTSWSSAVAIREHHELIRTGPYRLMRHPIYTGMLIGMAGTALVRGEISGVVGFGVAVIAFYVKARREEGYLRQEFGATFAKHARETGMFLPRLSS
jgi:protein-S-isoprenylcysteine O-methyltransferase Ste14